ncbi:MAG: DUF4349 domain-containing protein [Polyangiaceae bacterium]
MRSLPGLLPVVPVLRRSTLRRGALALVLAAAASFLSACGGASAPKAASPGGYAAQSYGGIRSAESVTVASRTTSTEAVSAEESSPAMSDAPPPPPLPAQAPIPPVVGAVAGAAQVGDGSPRGVVSTLAPSDAPREKPADGSMIVYTANVTLAVYQVQAGLEAVEARTRDLGGYLARKTDTSVTVRIPRDRFRDALAAVEKIGDVVHRQIDAEDVSSEYVDLEARARNARVTRDRLEELLKKAAVKEAIEIQRELAKVTEELERLEGQMKLLRSKFAYATLTVSFSARAVTGPARTQIQLPFPWLSELGLGRLLDLSH